MQQREQPPLESKAIFRAKGVLIRIALAAFIIGGFGSGSMAAPRLVGWAAGLAPTALTERLLPIDFVTSTARAAPEWEGHGRVNVLVMGIDQRPDETAEPTRTDT